MSRKFSSPQVFLQKKTAQALRTNRRSIPRDHAICRGSRPFHHRRRRPNSLRPASVPSRIGCFGGDLGGVVWDRFLETRRIMWVYYVYVYVNDMYLCKREGGRCESVFIMLYIYTYILCRDVLYTFVYVYISLHIRCLQIGAPPITQ